jgi:putative ABC transport system permease protein
MSNPYINLMFRNFSRNKTFSVINIIGLAIGISCVILILSWVRYEVSFDKYHAYADRIYRVERRPFCTLAPSFAPLMKKDFPEIEKMVRMVDVDEYGLRFKYNENSNVEKKVCFSEPEIFDIFSLEMLYGDPKTALTQQNSIVLTEAMASKYFGKETPLGKVILFEDKYLLNVTGVIKNIPINSHYHFNFLISFLALKNWDDDYYFGGHTFNDNACLTYIRLAKGANPQSLEAKFPKFIDTYIGPNKDEAGNLHKASENDLIALTKVSDIHLYSHTKNEVESNGDGTYVKIFTLVAFFILLIACINFINLSIAKNLKRTRSISLRKIFGSKQRDIVIQLMLESTIYVTISFAVAMILFVIVSPHFNSLWSGWVSQNLFGNKSNWLILLVILIFSILMTGVYPAFFISGFKPLEALKKGAQVVSQYTSKAERSPLRKSLVILQFSVSIAIIICMGIIHKQLNFMQNSPLGFDKDNVVILPADGTILNKWNEFKQELLRNNGISQVTKSKRAPSGRLLDDAGYEITINGKLLNSPVSMPHNRVEQDFFKTYGIKIVAGRDFDKTIPSDSSESAVLNETALNNLGFKSPAQALGTLIKINGINKTIIGVSGDFHYESFHHKISAIVTYVSNESNTIAIRLVPGNVRERMKVIEKVWNDLHPGNPLIYSFLDEKVGQQYQNEQRMLTLFNYFGILAIFIACLGLYGLASYSTERRTKEIGIRKSNGATTTEILTMLSINFTKWVVVAFMLVCPLTYYLMDKWLQNFAYRTELSWWIFVAAGAIALIIAWFTISWQSWRAATRNPVEALRYE